MQYRPILFALTLASSLVACKSSEFGYAVNGEKARIRIDEKTDAINYAALKKQEVPTLSDRATGAARGLPITPLLGGAVSLATNAIKQVIANERKKYIADYGFAMNDLYFYDQLSTESCFDPVGMQFNGFVLLRTFVNKAGQTDTAFYARFALDTTKPNEIINNSVFRLRLSELRLNYTKAKLTAAQKREINMDIDISFHTSYVNTMGQLFDNVELGHFYLFLRGAPLDKTDPNYEAYYRNLKNTPIEGRSFIVPRSFGYHINAENEATHSYSQGAYSIKVNVKESTKDKFVTKILVDNSSRIIDVLGGKAKDAVKKIGEK